MARPDRRARSRSRSILGALSCAAAAAGSRAANPSRPPPSTPRAHTLDRPRLEAGGRAGPRLQGQARRTAPARCEPPVRPAIPTAASTLSAPMPNARDLADGFEVLELVEDRRVDAARTVELVHVDVVRPQSAQGALDGRPQVPWRLVALRVVGAGTGHRTVRAAPRHGDATQHACCGAPADCWKRVRSRKT